MLYETLILLAQLPLNGQTTADQVLDRFAAFSKSVKTLRVQVRARAPQTANEGVGALTLQAPANIRFAMKWNNEEYDLVGNTKGSLEVGRSSRMYLEQPPSAVYATPAAGLSWIPDLAFPWPIVLGDFRAVFPRGTPFKLVHSEPDGSATVSATLETPSMTLTQSVTVDPKGRLTKWTATRGSESSGATYALEFTDYVVNGPVDRSAFDARLPAGFVPKFVSIVPHPVLVDEKASLGGVKALVGGGVTNLRHEYKNRPLLVALVAPDCRPSDLALSSLRGEMARIRAKGGDVAVLWTKRPESGTASRGFRSFLDAQGSAYDRFRVEATPFFVLVDKLGTVRRVWMGFDPARKNEFLKEVVSSVDLLSRQK